MGKTKIRTTINPGEILTVDDAELLDLTRQWLVKSLVDDEDKKTADKKGA